MGNNCEFCGRDLKESLVCSHCGARNPEKRENSEGVFSADNPSKLFPYPDKPSDMSSERPFSENGYMWNTCTNEDVMHELLAVSSHLKYFDAERCRLIDKVSKQIEDLKNIVLSWLWIFILFDFGFGLALIAWVFFPGGIGK